MEIYETYKYYVLFYTNDYRTVLESSCTHTLPCEIIKMITKSEMEINTLKFSEMNEVIMRS